MKNRISVVIANHRSLDSNKEWHGAFLEDDIEDWTTLRDILNKWIDEEIKALRDDEQGEPE